MAAETQYTGNTGMVTISTANSNLNGSGTLGTALTAGTFGTLIKKVTIKAQGSTSQGMVRLFTSDGTNNNLLTEVRIPVTVINTTTGTDASFETTLSLSYDLGPGCFLKASTQVGETFNIITEGLDWAYRATGVRPESTNYTANTGMTLISTANTALDGSGTLGTVLTAGAASANYKGCSVKSITITATGTVTSGMVRLFINNGTTNFLFTEVFVKPIPPTGTYKSFTHKIDFNSTLQLAPGYSIKASTQNAASFAIIADAMDWNYPGVPNNYSPVTFGPSSTTEHLCHSYQIQSGLFSPGNILSVYGAILINNDSHNKTFKIYINTSNSLTGATLIGVYEAAFAIGDSIERMFPVLSDTSLECYAGTTTVFSPPRSQYTISSANNPSGSVTVPSLSAGFWVLISGQNASSVDTTTLRWSMVRKLI